MRAPHVVQLKGDGMSRLFLTMAIAYTAQQAVNGGGLGADWNGGIDREHR